MTYGRALGGGPLDGGVMRIVYLDEAGISKMEHEPFTVVAGVIIDGDNQWKSLEQHLVELADKYAPPDKREGFVFHATELFSGGKVFPREKYSREQRWEILDQILAIPGKFHLPIVMGFAERKPFMESVSTENAGLSFSDGIAATVTSAFIQCAMFTERVMRATFPDEVAMIVMENNGDCRKLVHETHILLRSPQTVESLIRDEDRPYLPLTKIIDAPLFAEKTDASILQVADACAFAIKRHLQATAESRRFYAPLIPNLMSRPVSDGELREALSPEDRA